MCKFNDAAAFSDNSDAFTVFVLLFPIIWNSELGTFPSHLKGAGFKLKVIVKSSSGSKSNFSLCPAFM